MQVEDRHQAITELAERLLAVAEATHANAPKLMLPGQEVPPPPIQWHTAYCGAQFAEPLLRLLVLRKAEIEILKSAMRDLGESAPTINVPRGFNQVVAQCAGEANRVLQAFNIQLKQEI